MSLCSDFGNVLEYGLHLYGSVDKLARATGVSETLISSWKDHRQTPGFEDLCRFSDTMGLRLVPGMTMGGTQHDDVRAVPLVRTDRILPPGPIADDFIEGWQLINTCSRQGLPEDDLFFVRITKLEHYPDLKPGTRVLINRSEREIKTRHLYLIKDNGRMGVRRIDVAHDGEIVWRDVDTGRPVCKSAGEGKEIILGMAVSIQAEIADGLPGFIA